MNLLHTLGNDFTFSRAQREIFKQYITDYTTELKGGSIPNDLTREKVIELVNEYGPIFKIHRESNIMPINIEDYWIHYRHEIRSGIDYMIERDELKSANQTFRWYFNSPSTLKDVKTYVFIRSLPGDEFGLYFVLFFPFNRGKKIKIINSTMGSHSMDLVSCAIIFNKDYKPVKNFLQTHSTKRTWLYKKNEGSMGLQEVFNRRNIYHRYENNHMIILLSARGNEGYPDAGFNRYTYVDKAVLKLRDYLDPNGYRYESYNRYLILMPENLYGYDNIAYDNMGNKYDLSIPGTDITNWPNQLEYIGNRAMGKVEIKGIFKEYRRSGEVHLKNSEYLIADKKNGQDIETEKYLQSKNLIKL